VTKQTAFVSEAGYLSEVLREIEKDKNNAAAALRAAN